MNKRNKTLIEVPPVSIKFGNLNGTVVEETAETFTETSVPIAKPKNNSLDGLNTVIVENPNKPKFLSAPSSPLKPSLLSGSCNPLQEV